MDTDVANSSSCKIPTLIVPVVFLGLLLSVSSSHAVEQELAADVRAKGSSAPEQARAETQISSPGLATSIASSTYSNFIATSESEKKSISKNKFFFYPIKGANDSYSFVAPPGWKVHGNPGMSYMRVENFEAKNITQQNKKDYLKIEVVVLPSQDLTLDQWLERQNTQAPPLPNVLESREIKVDGERGIYQLEQFGDRISPTVYVLKNNAIYVINPSAGSEEFNPVIDDFIANFRFRTFSTYDSH